jgi:hypothetical protein
MQWRGHALLASPSYAVVLGEMDSCHGAGIAGCGYEALRMGPTNCDGSKMSAGKVHRERA